MSFVFTLVTLFESLFVRTSHRLLEDRRPLVDVHTAHIVHGLFPELLVVLSSSGRDSSSEERVVWVLGRGDRAS